MKHWIQVIVASFLVFILVILVNVQYKASYLDRVVGCNPDALHFLHIYHKDGSVLQLEKKAGTNVWEMSFGDWHSQVADAAADRISRLVCLMAYEEKLSISPEQYADFGIHKAAPRIHFKGEVEGELRVGSLTPEGTEYYLASSLDEQHLFTFSNLLYNELFAPALALTERNIFRELDFSSAQVTNSYGEVFELQKFETSWIDKQQALNTELATALMTLLQDLRFGRYIGPATHQEAEEYGFALPDFSITLSGKNMQEPRQVELCFFENALFYYTSFFGQNYIFVADPAITQAYKELHAKFILQAQ